MQFVNWGQIKFTMRIKYKNLGKECNVETYIHSWMDGQRIMKASVNWICTTDEGQWSNLLPSMCSHSSRSMLVANIRWPSLIFIVSFSYLREWRAPPPRLIMGSSKRRILYCPFRTLQHLPSIKGNFRNSSIERQFEDLPHCSVRSELRKQKLPCSCSLSAIFEGYSVLTQKCDYPKLF